MSGKEKRVTPFIDVANAENLNLSNINPEANILSDLAIPRWEYHMLRFINDTRLIFLGPGYLLKYDPALSVVANKHSLDMASRNYFDHVSPEGQDLVNRLESGHICCTLAGENIAFRSIGLSSIYLVLRSQHEGLMDSPAHRANLLNPEFTYVGIGIIRRNGVLYTTEVFVDVVHSSRRLPTIAEWQKVAISRSFPRIPKTRAVQSSGRR